MALTRALGVLLLLLGGCSKPEEKPRRTEPWPAPPAASSAATSPSVPGPRRFRFTPDSRVLFSLAGKKGKVSGRFSVAEGRLELDPREPKNTRANLAVDLTTLAIDTEPPAGVELGGSPHAIGLQWLELGALVPAARRQPFELARFELTSLEGPTASERAARRVTGSTPVVAVGTLLLHGFRAPVRVDLRVAGGGSERLSIRSARPFVVPLAPHDLTARDPSGVVDTLGAARAADWIGKSASVTLELFAEPEPGSK